MTVCVELFDGEYISGWSENNFIYLKFEDTGVLFTIPVNIKRVDGCKGFEYQINSEDNGNRFTICDENHNLLIDKTFYYKKFNNKVTQDSDGNSYLVESRDLNIYKIISENLEYGISDSARKNFELFFYHIKSCNSLLIIPDKLNFLLSKQFNFKNIFPNDCLVDYKFGINSFIRNDTHISDTTILNILNNFLLVDIKVNFIHKDHIGDLSKEKVYLPQFNLDSSISFSRLIVNYEIYGNINSFNCDFVIIGKSTAEKFAKILSFKYKVIYINSKEFRYDLINYFDIKYTHLLYMIPQRFLYSFFKIEEFLNNES